MYNEDNNISDRVVFPATIQFMLVSLNKKMHFPNIPGRSSALNYNIDEAALISWLTRRLGLSNRKNY